MILYNLGIFLLEFGIRLAAIFNKKAALLVNGRKDSMRLLKQFHQTTQPNATIYWFHCASLGEFEQARPLMEAIRATQPEIRFVVSFFSPSGYEIQKNYALADFVFYLPSATASNAMLVIDCIKPEKMFFIKYEFWIHYIQTAYRRNIPVYLVSALFNPNQIFFKWYGKIYLNLLPRYKCIFVQDVDSITLLKKHGIDSKLSGDTRFDRVIANKAKARDFDIIQAFISNQKVLVLGSSWHDEERLLFKALGKNLSFKIVIAPHDITRTINVPDNFSSLRFSEATIENVASAQVLIIDNIGMLASLYRCANVALVGGGFRSSLHNILEAAVYGIPVLYGNQTNKHPEAEQLVAAGGGVIFHNEVELKTQLQLLFHDEFLQKKMGESASRFIENNAGATAKILAEI